MYSFEAVPPKRLSVYWVGRQEPRYTKDLEKQLGLCEANEKSEFIRKNCSHDKSK
jgi:hypothetical protein